MGKKQSLFGDTDADGGEDVHLSVNAEFAARLEVMSCEMPCATPGIRV